MTSLIQRSFAGGEVAPAVYGRADLVKVQTGLRVCRNFMVQRFGGVTNRPGTEFVAPTKAPFNWEFPPALIDFIFNNENAYTIEVGDEYMRFHFRGAPIMESATITAVDSVVRSNPAVINATGHPFSNGDQVMLWDVEGTFEANNRQFIVANAAANSFELSGIDSTGWGTPIAATGQVARVYEIATPYAKEDVAAIKYSQSADVISMAHRDYPPMELKRLAADNWELDTISWGPQTDSAENLLGTPGAAGTEIHIYKVTAIDAATDEEGLEAREAVTAITAITNANPPRVTAALHGLDDGDQVYIDGVAGMTELNRRVFSVSKFSNNEVDLLGVDATVYGTYISGGDIGRAHVTVTSATPTAAVPNVVDWDAVAGAKEYWIYRDFGGFFGFIGVAQTNTYNDIGVTPDVTVQPPVKQPYFLGTGNYPSTVTYFQQRVHWGASTLEPEMNWLTETGNYHSFVRHFPIRDSDAMAFQMAGREVNEVRHLVEIGKPIILASGAEWALDGVGNGFVTPTAINAHQQSAYGANDIRPAIIGNHAIFAQAQGQIIRTLRYQESSAGYAGDDLTVFAPHLFGAREKYISAWAYQQTPHSIVWAVRADGMLLGLTYMPEHEVWGWHRHDTATLEAASAFRDVVVIPEKTGEYNATTGQWKYTGNEDFPYFVIRRLVDGEWHHYIERLSSREILDFLPDTKFVDSHVSFNGAFLTNNGWNDGAFLSLSLGGSSDWSMGNTFDLSCGFDVFKSWDVGNGFWLVGGGEYAFVEITSVTDSKNAEVIADRDLHDPGLGGGEPIKSWYKAYDTFYGLDHLEGERVSIVADGHVEPQQIVVDGKVTLERPYGIVHIGLPIVADVETLDLEVLGAETLIDKKKRVNEVSLYIEDTRGLKIGEDAQHLDEYPSAPSPFYDFPVQMITGVASLNIGCTWNDTGRVFIRQDQPLPATILNIIPSGFVGG